MDFMQNYKITTFCAPATMYRFMIKEDIDQFDFSYLHHCCMAGEPLNPEVFNQWERITGHKLYEGFGQTEGPVLLANFKWLTPKPGSTGKPTPAFDITDAELVRLKLSAWYVKVNGKLYGIIETVWIYETPLGVYTGWSYDTAYILFDMSAKTKAKIEHADLIEIIGTWNIRSNRKAKYHYTD